MHAPSQLSLDAVPLVSAYQNAGDAMWCIYKSHLFSYLFRLSLMQQMPSAQPKCNTKYRIANKLKTGSPLFPRLCACVECVFFSPLAGPIRDLQHKARRQMQGRSCLAGQRLVEPVPSVVGISTQR
jgi:hypothetical protein